MKSITGGGTVALRAVALSLFCALAAPHAVLAVESAPQATAAALPKGVARVTSVEGITEYRLDNGMRVLLYPDPSKPTLTVNVTYLVGSRHENYGETGMAHLLEHLLFKGTPKNPDIPKQMSERGARFNASTWVDRTNYFSTVPASDENLAWALALEADRMVNSYVAKKDLDTEMTVVRNEFESGENNPLGVLFQRTMSTAFLWHNYGNSTIGARSDIENVPIERLQAFYRTFYQPDNAVLLVAGKFDEAKALDLVAKHFGALPKPARQLQRTYTAEPTQDGERTVTLRRAGDTQAAVAIYHVPPGAHPDAAAVALLSSVLGDVPAGRLHKALVETKKATQAGAFTLSTAEPGVLALMAQARQDQSIDEARDTMLKVAESLATTPITKEEVERARASALNGIDATLNNADRIGVGLSEYIAMGDWRLFFLNRDRLKAVTAEDVQRVALAYLKPTNRSVGVFVPTANPDRAEIPQAPDVLAMVKDYKGQETAKAGEAWDPSTENIEARTKRLTLPNGLEVALLPKDTRGDSVVVAMTLRHGSLEGLENRETAGDLAGDMLMRGTRKRTRQQIAEELDRLQARGGVSGGATQAGAGYETRRETLADVLRLTAEILREPAFPASEFEQLKQERIAALEERRSDPQAIAGLHFQRHVSPYPKGDPRYVSTFEEAIADLNAVTLDDVKKFHADFYGASHGEIAIVGDFDEKEVTALLTELFGTWKSPAPYARLEGVFKDAATINESLETPDKANAIFLAGMMLPLRDDDPDYAALVVGNYILGGGTLNSRLGDRIRQKEGLSYGVGSSLSAGSMDKIGSFTAFAIYAPENAARLEAAFREEIARMLKDGFTPEEVAAAKAALLQSRQVGRAQDGSLARALASYLYLDRTYQWDADFERKIQALTPEQVVAAMRRHIDPSKISVVKAGDFSKK